MTTQFRPMLGVTCSLPDIQYPVIASPKLDGVRAMYREGYMQSRTLKAIPNRHIQYIFGEVGPWIEGFDGELVLGDPTASDLFSKTISAVMTEGGRPNVHWYVFDNFTKPEKTFLERIHSQQLHEIPYPTCIKVIEQRAVWSEAELLNYEAGIVDQGYEGLILRHPNRPYKYGRSTLREGGMLKLKRFVDDEAIVVDFEELMHNANPATADKRGYTKRTSHQHNKIPTNTLGAIVVNWRGHHLRVGTGFTAHDRTSIWQNRSTYQGKLVKFKYLPIGMKDLPRHPVFLSWRHPDDA